MYTTCCLLLASHKLRGLARTWPPNMYTLPLMSVRLQPLLGMGFFLQVSRGGDLPVPPHAGPLRAASRRGTPQRGQTCDADMPPAYTPRSQARAQLIGNLRPMLRPLRQFQEPQVGKALGRAVSAPKHQESVGAQGHAAVATATRGHLRSGVTLRQRRRG